MTCRAVDCCNWRPRGLALPALPRIARAQAYPSPPDHHDRALRGRRPDRHGRPRRRRADAGRARPAGRAWRMSAAPAAASALGRVAARGAGRLHHQRRHTGAPTSSTARSTRCPTTCKTDFEPIALLAQAPQMVVAQKATAGRTICKSFIAWLKANPDKTTAGTAGIGSPPHIGGVLFQKHDRHALPVRALSRRARRRRRTWSPARSTW